jgi:hypothetical protein
LVAQAIQDGESIEAALQQPLPAPLDAWSIDGTPLEANA